MTNPVMPSSGDADLLLLRKRVEALERQIGDWLQPEFELVTDRVPALISYVDTRQRFVRVNRAYEELFGIKREQILGRTIAEVVGPEHYTVARPFLERALSGEPVTFSSRVRHHDGTLRDIELSYAPDVSPDNKVRGIVVMVNDTTERNGAEEARARLAAVVESSDDAIISKTLEGIITSWNPAAERIFGYTAAEAIGRNITLVIPEERLSEEEEVLSRLRRGEKIDHFETERKTKEGRLINISLTVSPVRNAAGQVIGASKIARDITREINERKQAEAERRMFLAREQKARETAELLNRVGPVLTSELDPPRLAQTITDIATQAVRAEFGAFFHNVLSEAGDSYMLYTLSGVPAGAFENFPMPRNTAIFAETFRGESAVRSSDITKDPRYGKNPPFNGMPEGHLPVCSYLAVPVVSRTGAAVGGIFFGHSKPDMFSEEAEQIALGIAGQAAIALDNAALFADVQRSHDALRRSNEDLKRANEDLNQFAHSASHDLQEPLRTVSIYSQLLRRKFAGRLDGEGDEYIGYVLKGAARMEALLRGLLAYTKATSPGQKPVRMVDSNAVLEDVISDLRAAIEDSSAQVSYDCLPEVRVHDVHLTQLFQNLIGNAIKYRGDEPPEITISAERRQNEWLFSVRDNGIGIDVNYQEHIFGIFQRLHSADDYSGAGIGLAICQRVVERAGGRIWVESQLGKGSTFFFTLPAGD